MAESPASALEGNAGVWEVALNVCASPTPVANKAAHHIARMPVRMVGA
jgi:hypothetical protein